MIKKFNLTQGLIIKAHSLLSAKNQNGQPVVYANACNQDSTFELACYVTGEKQDDSKLIYLDTIMSDHDTFVLHVFYKVL